MRRFALFLALLPVAIVSLSAAAEAPSASRLLDQARKKFLPVNDYVADVRLDVKGEQIAIKGMTMTLYYKKPDKTKIVAKQGFAAMPRDVILGNVIDEVTKNCEPVLLRTEKKNGLDCYVLRLKPKGQSPRPKTVLWLDKSRMLVRAARMDGPYPVKTEWQYARVDEKYDLPRRIDAQVTSPATSLFPRRHHSQPQPTGGTQTIQAILTFSNYRVNRGIPDSLFAPEKPDK